MTTEIQSNDRFAGCTAYPLVKYPDDRLTKKNVEVPAEQITTPQFKAMVNNLLFTVHFRQALGLAAPQCGINQRIVVLNTDPFTAMINPIIIAKDGHQVIEEGCLSLPTIFEQIERASKVVVVYQDIDGQPNQLTAEGLLAQCIQHEIDHLDGKLMLDHLPILTRVFAKRKMKKLPKEKV